MSERTVYIDFQDGNGFIDISDYVKYDTLTYKLNAFNNTFKYAQNTCSFDVVYDAALYDKFVSATKDTLIRILDVDGNAPILTEAYEEILTEDGVALLVEQQWAEPVFYGHMPLTRAREYNGVIDNTFFSVEATDELDSLDVKIGDIVLTNNTIMASATPAASIVHQLAAIAGWNSSRVFPDTYISTVLAKFAPQSEDDSVLEVLSTLLYEYGYSLSLDAQSRIHPILWNVTTVPSTVAEFNEDNIIDTITIADDFNQYDGGEVQYCELGHSENVRLYTDSNCPRSDNSDFSGYDIINESYYPTEANTIDETTGVNQVVYQEYTDTAIKYITNYSIRNNLDLNYSVFDSDFSGIVATANHWVDRKADAGLTITLESFGNKKCQLLYRNTTGSTKKLYYNDVYGDIWYKSSNRTIDIDFVTNPSNRFSYSMKYVFEKALADAFIKGIMANYENGCAYYSFVSEEVRAVGDIVRVRLDEGTNQLGIISNKSWDEGKELWTYSVVAVYPTKPALTGQDVFTGTVEVVLPIIDSYATANNLTIPYNNGSPDFTNAFVDMHVTRDGIDVSSDWTYSAIVSGLTGAFSPTIPNRYIISVLSLASATLDITASRLNWSNQVQHITIVAGSDSAGIAAAQAAAQGYADDLAVALQDDIDGKITTWYQATQPSSGMTLGDLWVDTDDGNNMYRYDGSTWVDIQDTAISTAYNLANGKRVTWATLALAQASAVVGDYFLDNGLLYYCDRTSSAITIANSTRKTPRSWGNQATAPSSGMVANDSYYNTTNLTWYYYNGSSWVIDGDPVNNVVYTYTPKYRGIGLLASGSNATFQSASVDTSGIINVGSSISANAGDWMLNYSTANGLSIALYVWNGSTWSTSTDVRYMDSCSTDIFNLKTGGIEISGYMTVINAVIKNLMVSQLKLLTGGKLFSGAGNFNNADTPVYLDAAGNMSLGTGLVWDGESLTIDGDITAHYLSVSNVSIEGMYYGVPALHGSLQSLNSSTTVNRGAYAIGDSMIAVTVESPSALDNERITTYRWSGNSFSKIGSAFSSYDTIKRNAVVTQNNVFHAIADVYSTVPPNAPVLIGSDRLAQYTFDTVSSTWSRTWYSSWSFPTGTAISYDGNYIYAAVPVNSTTIEIRQYLPHVGTPLNVYSFQGYPLGVSLAFEYIGNNYFVLVYSYDSTTQGCGLFYRDPLSYTVTRTSYAVFSGVVGNPRICVMSLNNFVIRMSSGTGPYTTQFFYFRVFDGGLIGDITRSYPAVTSDVLGMTVIDDTKLAMIEDGRLLTNDPLKYTLGLYSLGVSLGRPYRAVT